MCTCASCKMPKPVARLFAMVLKSPLTDCYRLTAPSYNERLNINYDEQKKTHHFRIEPLASQLMLALNEEYIEKDAEELTLKAGDQLAVIPPLSGG